MDLRDREVREKSRNYGWPVGFAVLALLFTAYWAAYRGPAPRFQVQLFGEEERQQVFSILDRIEKRHPEFVIEARKIRDFLTKNPTAVRLVRSSKAHSLVKFENNELQISTLFFEADSLTQERSFVRTVETLQSLAKRN